MKLDLDRPHRSLDCGARGAGHTTRQLADMLVLADFGVRDAAYLMHSMSAWPWVKVQFLDLIEAMGYTCRMVDNWRHAIYVKETRFLFRSHPLQLRGLGDIATFRDHYTPSTRDQLNEIDQA